jgi:hypothetical protein
MARNAKEQLKSKKMTLKELWRVKNKVNAAEVAAYKERTTQCLKNQCR